MKRIALLSFFLFVLSCSYSRSQEVVGHFRQDYFSVRGDYYSGVYAVATPSHKNGAALIRVHGKTVIDIIYIVVDFCDLPDFIDALENCKQQFLSSGNVDYDFFPPVSIMWRNRELHIWEEAFGYIMSPDVFRADGTSYLAFMGNAVNNFAPERQSGNYFLMLNGRKEIDSVLELLRSPKLKSLISRAPVDRHPFE